MQQLQDSQQLQGTPCPGAGGARPGTGDLARTHRHTTTSGVKARTPPPPRDLPGLLLPQPSQNCPQVSQVSGLYVMDTFEDDASNYTCPICQCKGKRRKKVLNIGNVIFFKYNFCNPSPSRPSCLTHTHQQPPIPRPSAKSGRDGRGGDPSAAGIHSCCRDPGILLQSYWDPTAGSGTLLQAPNSSSLCSAAFGWPHFRGNLVLPAIV